MKRRFKAGVELDDRQFHAQPWVSGLLQYQGSALYLCASTPDGNPPPFGMLYRPALKACILLLGDRWKNPAPLRCSW